ncbi:hypothetical protein DFJ73DRAFT_957288 [Zopfochytrium polystomum]|nr:hypothetical protein DFJ73DRAFT_957288 [Zopfochytrium polystomum]
MTQRPSTWCLPRSSAVLCPLSQRKSSHSTRHCLSVASSSHNTIATPPMPHKIAQHRLDDEHSCKRDSHTADAVRRPSQPKTFVKEAAAVFSVLALVAGLLLPFAEIASNLSTLRSGLIPRTIFSSHEPLLAPHNSTQSTSATFASAPNSRSYFHDDFPTHFGLSVLHTTHVDPAVAQYLSEHDLREDDKYAEDPDVAEEWRRRIGWALEEGFPFDQRFEVRWVSREVGYGVFAKMHVAKGSIVGVFGSVVTSTENSDYMWTYPSEILDEDGNAMPLGFDAQYRGNFLRFVNHREEPNTEVVLIEAGEEVTVNYGADYWENRPGVLVGESSHKVVRAERAA